MSAASAFPGAVLVAGAVGTNNEYNAPTLPAVNPSSLNSTALGYLGPSIGANVFLQFGTDRIV